jgi:branched-chain amino acid transport system substrate-binding protein
VTDFTNTFHAAPGPYSAYEYDAIYVAAKAIKDAGSTDPDAIKAALHKVKNFNGLTGTISFNSVGDRTVAVYITLVVKDGVFAPGMMLSPSGQWVPVGG